MNVGVDLKHFVLATGQHLITNPECAKTYTDKNFRIIGQQDRHFIQVFWNLFT